MISMSYSHNLRKFNILLIDYKLKRRITIWIWIVTEKSVINFRYVSIFSLCAYFHPHFKIILIRILMSSDTTPSPSPHIIWILKLLNTDILKRFISTLYSLFFESALNFQIKSFLEIFKHPLSFLYYILSDWRSPSQ